MYRKIIIDLTTNDVSPAADCSSKDFSAAITEVLNNLSLDISKTVKPTTYRLLVLWETALENDSAYQPTTFVAFTSVLADIQDIQAVRDESRLSPTADYDWHIIKTILDKHQQRLTEILGKLFENQLKQTITPLSMEAFIDNLEQGQFFLRRIPEKTRNGILHHYVSYALEKLDTQEHVFSKSEQLEHYYDYIHSIDQNSLLDQNLKTALKIKLAYHFKRFQQFTGNESIVVIRDILEHSEGEEWGSPDKTYTILASTFDKNHKKLHEGLHGIEGRQAQVQEETVVRLELSREVI